MDCISGKRDLNYWSKIADAYGFLTYKSLDTLKRHGNLLVSLTRFEKALRKVSEIKFKNKIEKIVYNNPNESLMKLYIQCTEELLAECGRLSGYTDLNFRTVPATNQTEPITIIIERGLL